MSSPGASLGLLRGPDGAGTNVQRPRTCDPATIPGRLLRGAEPPSVHEPRLLPHHPVLGRGPSAFGPTRAPEGPRPAVRPLSGRALLDRCGDYGATSRSWPSCSSDLASLTMRSSPCRPLAI